MVSEVDVMEKERRDRVFYLDLLRIISTFAVIMIHVAAQNWYSTDVKSSEWLAFNVYDSLVRWAVPVFVMISGALFLNPEREVSTKKLFSRSILRLATAYLFWNVLYALYNNGVSFGSIGGFIGQVIRGNYHMWFIPMMMCLYVLVPLLRKITESWQTVRYYMIVAFVFTFVIPVVLDFSYMGDVKAFYENANFHFTVGYTCYFIAGYYLSKVEMPKCVRALVYLLGVLSFIMIAYLTARISMQRHRADERYYREFTMFVMMEAVAIFTFARYGLSKLRLSDRSVRSLRVLAECSFGVYLVHEMLICVFRDVVGFNTLSFAPVAAVPVLVLCVAALGYLISWLIRKIPGLGRYIS